MNTELCDSLCLPMSCLVREWTIQFVFLRWFSKNIYKKNWDGRGCGLNIHIFPKAISSRSEMKRYRQYKTKSGWSGKYMRIKSISTLAQNWHQKSNKPTEVRCTMRSTEKGLFLSDRNLRNVFVYFQREEFSK